MGGVDGWAAAVRQARRPTGEAIGSYLPALNHPETTGTARVYASTLRQLGGLAC